MKKNLAGKVPVLRNQYKVQKRQMQSTTWSYFDIGHGKRNLVILPDVMGTYEAWFPYVPFLSRTYRIIIPLYPPLTTPEEMITSLHEFLAICNIHACDLIGVSLGGLFAQVYVRKYPKQVGRMLLLATGTPDWVFGTVAFCLLLAGYIAPQGIITFIVILAAFLSLSVPKESQVFWKKYLSEQISMVDTKKNMLAWGKCIISLCWKTRFSSKDLTNWKKPIYLIEATHDLVFNPFTRAHLRRLYPQAYIYTLNNEKHLVWINRFNLLMDILQKFIL